MLSLRRLGALLKCAEPLPSDSLQLSLLGNVATVQGPTESPTDLDRRCTGTAREAPGPKVPGPLACPIMNQGSVSPTGIPTPKGRTISPTCCPPISARRRWENKPKRQKGVVTCKH